MILYPLSRQEVLPAWEIIEPFARQMAERFPDDWPVDEILRQATEADLVLWLIWSEEERVCYGVIGTEVKIKASGKRVLVLSLAAGREHERWMLTVESRISDHAKANDCATFIVEGRTGWARWLPDLPGWQRQRWITASKELG